jgi:hypothetical protein
MSFCVCFYPPFLQYFLRLLHLFVLFKANGLRQEKNKVLFLLFVLSSLFVLLKDKKDAKRKSVKLLIGRLRTWVQLSNAEYETDTPRPSNTAAYTSTATLVHTEMLPQRLYLSLSACARRTRSASGIAPG